MSTSPLPASETTIESLEQQRYRLQHQLQHQRQQIIKQLGILHGTSAAYPRSMTMRLLSNRFTTPLAIHFALSLVRDYYPRLSLIGNVFGQYMFRKHPVKPEASVK